MGGSWSADSHDRELVFHFHFWSFYFQGTMLADDIDKNRLKTAEQFCRRILELSNQGKFVDVEVKMEAGEVKIWQEKVKHKPK